jgi:hypothetical protein
MAAASTGEPKLVWLLLEAGANAGAIDARGMTAIDHARADGHPRVVRLLSSVVGVNR